MPPRSLRRNRIGDHVDKAADRVRAVQQRRGTAHHFDPPRGRRIGRDRVIAGLARQIAHALAVFEHRDAIAVEAANDWSRRGGAELAHRDPGSLRQRRANRRLEVLRQLLPVEHRRRLIRLELRPRGGTDGKDFREMQIEIDRDVERHRRRADADLGAPRAVTFRANTDVILPRRHVLESVTAVDTGAHFPAQLVDHDQGTGQRLAVFGLGDRAAQRGSRLPTVATFSGGGRSGTENRQQQNNATRRELAS